MSMITIELHLYEGPLFPEVLEKLGALCLTIHGVGDASWLHESLRGQQQILACVASAQGKPIGYSLGFQERPYTFFSWMSGVLPEFRRQGIASAIMRRQHQWCHQHGMRHVSARIHNLNIPMLQLCLKHRYLITGSVMESEERLKVMLQHTLQGGMSHPREAISLDHDEPIGPRAVSAEISESLPLSQLELSDSSLEDELSDPGSD